jgi:hypothetical protein
MLFSFPFWEKRWAISFPKGDFVPMTVYLAVIDQKKDSPSDGQ